MADGRSTSALGDASVGHGGQPGYHDEWNEYRERFEPV
jgi:hypothetical protein